MFASLGSPAVFDNNLIKTPKNRLTPLKELLECVCVCMGWRERESKNRFPRKKWEVLLRAKRCLPAHKNILCTACARARVFSRICGSACKV